jgi:tetratricopeptide (TPR) repeat protein
MKKTRDMDTQNLDELFEKYRLAPDSFVFVPLADACRKSGQIEEALEICERGVLRHPGYASGHVVKGKCLFDLGDRDGARRVFQHVLTLDENNLVALKFLGTIEADEGNLDTAQRHLQQILALDPENKEIRQILRLVEEKEQIQREEDREDGEEPQDPDMDEVDEILGSGEDDAPVDAAPEYDQAAENEPARHAPDVTDELETSDELASITLADIFASQGYAKKAEKIYREVLRKQPDSDMVRRKLAALSGKPVKDAATSNIEDNTASDDEPGAGEGPQESEQATVSDNAPDAAEVSVSEDAAVPVDAPTADQAEKAEQKPPKNRKKKSKRARRRARRNPEPVPAQVADHGRPDSRPEIDESDSLNHFRRWLDRVKD